MSTFQEAQIAYDMQRDSQYNRKDQVTRIMEELDDIEVLERAICENVDFEEIRLHLTNQDEDARNTLIGAMVCEAIDKYTECEIQRIGDSLGQPITFNEEHLEMEDIF